MPAARGWRARRRRGRNRLTCDENPRAGRDDAVRVRVVDAAVDRNRRVVAGRIEQGADRADFRLAARDESLAAKARVDGHEQHLIDVGGDFLERGHRRRRIDRHSGLDAGVPQHLQRPVQVRQHLDVHRDPRRSRVDERGQVVVRVVEHQVHVQRDGRDPVNGAHHRRANRQVGHEVAVHHVDVQQVGAAALDGGDVLPERREIRGQQRRSDQHAHLAADLERDRLPRAIWNPACGFCRRTMPAETPG